MGSVMRRAGMDVLRAWSRLRDWRFVPERPPAALAAAALVAVALILIAPPAARAEQLEGAPSQEPAASTAPEASPAPAQEPRPAFSAAIGVVVVDAVVTDEQGNPVTGLRLDDFVVREDGVGQTLTSFEAVDLSHETPAQAAPSGGRGASPARGPSTNAGERGAEPRRVFALVFDDLHLSPGNGVVARQALARFVEQGTRSGDAVTLVVPGAGLNWSGQMPAARAEMLKIIETLRGQKTPASAVMSDYEALSIERDRDARTQALVRRRLRAEGTLSRDFDLGAAERPGAESEMVLRDQSLIVEDEARRAVDVARTRRRHLLGPLTSLFDGLAVVKGRRAVVLVSEGFVLDPSETPMDDIVAASRRANAPLYFLDVRSLSTGFVSEGTARTAVSVVPASMLREDSAGSETLANETGGFTIRGGDAQAGDLSRVSRESSSYYLLGYSPTNTRRDGMFRAIQVEVTRPGVAVRVRSGYYAPSDQTPPRDQGPDGLAAALARARSLPLAGGRIPLSLADFAFQSVEKGKVRLVLAAEMGVRDLHFEDAPDGFVTTTLDMMMAIGHARPGASVVTPWLEWKLRLPAQARGADVWIPFERSFDLPPGMCQARLVIRERSSGWIGSVLRSFEIPETGAWRVSSPVLSNMPSGEAGERPRLLASRSFAAGSVLYCHVESYGAAKDPAQGAPRVTLGYALLDARGKTRLQEAARPFVLGRGGQLVRTIAIPLARVVPGEYELVLDVRDEVTGRARELREAFSVSHPSRPNAGLYADMVRTYLEGDTQQALLRLRQWPPEHLRELATALVRQEDETWRRAALLMHTELALDLWGHGRGAEAADHIAIGRALLEQVTPSDLHRDWLLLLGYARQVHGFAGHALELFAECARLYPEAAEAWLGAGTAHEYTAYPDGFGSTQLPVPPREAVQEAERCYREAVRLDPALTEARLRLGRVLQRAGRTEEAERELGRVIETSREAYLTALAHLFRGQLDEGRGRLAEAAQQYRAALDADRACQPAALALSHLLHESGHAREAAETLAAELRAAEGGRLSPWLEYHLALGRRYQPALAALRRSLPVAAESVP